MAPSFTINPIAILKSPSFIQTSTDDLQSPPRSPTLKLPRPSSILHKKNHQSQESHQSRFRKFPSAPLVTVSIRKSLHRHSSSPTISFNNNDPSNNPQLESSNPTDSNQSKSSSPSTSALNIGPFSVRSPKLSKSPKSSTNVTHSIVPPISCTAQEILILVHGMQGTVEDFNYLISSLKDTTAAKSGKLIVHASRVNTEKTYDGIVLGGLRLTEDIRSIIQANPTATTISMIGFSLGGMYVRYAVARMYDPTTKLIGGLKGGRVVIVATPNLGVRKFGVYRFIPFGLHGAGSILFGETARQLMLIDDEQIVKQMSFDGSQTGTQYLSALKAFEHRVLYANLRNDFMVNYGTAALDSSVQTLNGEQINRVEQRYSSGCVDGNHDEKGCRICFEFRYHEQPITEMEREEGMKKRTSDENVIEENIEVTNCMSGSNETDKENGAEEEVGMSQRLQKVGWKVIGVDFPMSMPIAHNRIVAMSRNAIHTWINAGGRRVVHHLVDTLVGSSFVDHEKKFQVVARN